MNGNSCVFIDLREIGGYARRIPAVILGVVSTVLGELDSDISIFSLDFAGGWGIIQGKELFVPVLKPVVWIVIGLILVALEMVIPGLVIIWFGVAAILTGILAIFVHNPNFQYVAFLVFSGLGVFLAQWIGRKITRAEPVGAMRLSGATGVVVEKIEPPKMGKVKVQGEDWRAEAKEVISPGERVRVLRVDGTHLIVEVLKKEE